MKMSELADLILIRLYELGNEQGRWILQDINAIAAQFGETNADKVNAAAEYLHKRRNFIEAIFLENFECKGHINDLGEHYVDTGGETGIIGKYKSNPSVYYIGSYTDKSINISGSNLREVNIAAHSENVKQTVKIHPEAESLLRQMIDATRKDPSLSDNEKNDILHDIDSIKNQLLKNNKDHTMIKSILMRLSQIASIGSFAINAYRLFYG